MPQRQPWQVVARDLVAVCMGRRPADLVIRNGRWVNVCTGEIIPATDLAILGSRIAYCGPDAGFTIGPATQVIQADGRYLVPGLLDGHMHVESAMVTVTQFVRAVLPHGTTGIFIDPHEMANVLGLRGVRLFVDEARDLPLLVYVEMPSCVPSASGLETTGAHIGPAEVIEAMKWDGIIGLGEMMNFPGVLAGDPEMHGEMAATLNAGKVIGGHYAAYELGPAFSAYVASGATDDHEGTREIDLITRLRNGMAPMMRLGSAWYDVAAQVTAITEKGLDSRHAILCTDDCHPGTLVHEGHMDRVVRHAISLGLRPMIAIQMATLNTAEHFKVSHDVGCIAPGRYADILLVSDLPSLRIDQVIAAGEVVASDGHLQIELRQPPYPADVMQTVRVARPLQAADFVLQANGASRVLAHVIGVIENQAPTHHLRLLLPVRDHQVSIDPGQDVSKVGLIERHRASGQVSLGFVQGLGLRPGCAIATTIAHDSHQLLVVGTGDADMALAANTLVESQGGVVVVQQGQILAHVALPIAGLISTEPAEVVAEKVEQVHAALHDCGCSLHNAFMQISLLALVVIPELRISDLGMVDTVNFKVIGPIE